MIRKISEISMLANKKIKTSLLTTINYVSTKNMLPNFAGISESERIPTGSATEFIKNDILISNINPYSKKIWYSDKHGGCSNDVLVIRCNKTIMSKYVFYMLNNEKFINYYAKTIKGTTIPRGDKNCLLNYQFNVPEYDVQQHIVNIISILQLKSF